MKIKVYVVSILAGLISVLSMNSRAIEHVEGYQKSDRTSVDSYYRRSPGQAQEDKANGVNSFDSKDGQYDKDQY